MKVMIPVCLASMVVLSLGYEYSRAESKPEAVNFKVGIVSVKKVFQDCRRNARYKEEATAEQNKIVAELEKLSKEIDAEKAGIKTLKVGSNDHLTQVKALLEKQAKYQAEEEFYKQQLSLKDQRWTEQLYQDILRITHEVAKQKGLDMVFEEDDIEFPTTTANELMLAIRTHKILYSAGCIDITSEVLAKLDTQ